MLVLLQITAILTVIAGNPSDIVAYMDAGVASILIGSGVTLNASADKAASAALCVDFIDNLSSSNPLMASQWVYV